ncbi:ankyrin-3 [Cladorrhinum sp. PSN332]|nr:ankyrin-3 [Cladorrhinum sp. PSN332]
MARRSLYDEALDRFKQEQAGTKDADLLKEFLRERATPEQTREAAEALQNDSGKKWGSRKLNGVEIPETWIANIMENIENVIEAGDSLTEGAPESIGLAWFAVRLTLKAINSNYELYTCFGAGLSDISEIMIIITHYDRLYDERNEKNFKTSPMVEKLFQDVVSVYAAVLDFSFAVKRHLTAGSLTRFKHGLKDFFGSSNRKFAEKLETIATLKTKILEESQGAFQDKALTQLEGVSDALSGIKKSVRDIREFQDEHRKLHSEQMAVLATLTSDLQDLRNSTKPKTRWDWAIHEYQKFQAALNPLKGSHQILEDIIDSVHPGTCQWIFEDDRYKRWDGVGSHQNLLCVTGEEGTGKSCIVASISQRIALEDGISDRELLYVSCGASPEGEATTEGGLNDPSRTSDAICRTLLFELYRLAAKEGDGEVELLEACNTVFKKAMEKAQALPNPTQDPRKLLPTFVDGIPKLVSLLKRDVVLVVDGINKASLDNKNQEELLRNLRAVSKPEANHIQVIIGCSSSTLIAKDVEGSSGSISLDVAEENRQDLDAVVAVALKEVPGLSAAEQEEAKLAISDKAQGSFRYVYRSAIPFMSEPFQRPLSARLKALPGGLGDNYAKAIRRLSPNYLALLRTALTRVLLAPSGRLSVREVMDAYQGTYNSPADADTEIDEAADNSESAKSSFPDPSRLEIQQLQDATESILMITRGDHRRGDLIICASDLELLSSFFCKSSDAEAEEETEEHLCARCQATRSKRTSLLVDAKTAHLEIALGCLVHMNNPLFQKRAGLVLKADSQQPETGEREPEVRGPTEEELKEVEARLEGGIGEEESADEEDGVENQIYDVEAEIFTAERKPKAPVKLSIPGRYEIQHWPYHLRMAESLWPADEREQSHTWAAVMAELDIFASRDHFSVWQAKYDDESSSEITGCFNISNGPHKPLHVAAYLGLESWAQHLADGGSGVNELSYGYAPLHAAVDNKDGLDMMKFLLSRGAEVNAKDASGRTVLHSWLLHGRPGLEEVKLLLSHGADATATDDIMFMSGMQYYALRGDNTDVFQLLLDHGAGIDDVHPNMLMQSPPLHLVMTLREKLSAELLQWFLDKGANPNSEDIGSNRPLTIASSWGQAENLKILLDAGIEDIDDPDSDGSTALQNAVFFNRPEVVKLLLDAGADPEKSDTLNRTCLHTAVRRGNMDCTRVLVEHGCNVNPKDRHGWTPLFCALLSRREGSHESANFILDALVQQNIPLSDINQPSRSRRTVLRQAATRGFDDIVSKLISLAAAQSDSDNLAVNSSDTKKGMTALHRAARGGHLACVKLLLLAEAGADATLKDSQSKTPLVHAYEQWSIASTEESRTAYEETVSLLVDSHPSSAPIQDAELVAACAVNGSVTLLRKLWALNADLSRPDKFGWTPLELAKGNPAAEDFLKQQDTWAKLLPSKWSTGFPGASAVAAKSVVASDENDGTTTTIVHTTGKRVCISADKPLPPRLDRYYFEVTIKELPKKDKDGSTGGSSSSNSNANGLEVHRPPKVAIGFATAPGTAIASLAGGEKKDAGGKGLAKVWSYHSSGGLSSPDQTSLSEEDDKEEREFWEYLRAFDVGDTVGCGVDLAKGEIWATRNGERLDQTLSLGVSGENRLRLFPIVGLAEDGVCFETNFGRWAKGRGFLWKWEGQESGSLEAVNGKEE